MKRALILLLALFLLAAPLSPAALAENSAQGLHVENGVVTGYAGTEAMLELPSGIVAIGPGAFRNALSLEEVILPEGVERIDRAAFSGCRNLRWIFLPLSLRDIAGDAFQDCPLLLLQGPTGAYARIYASDMGLTFRELSLPSVLSASVEGGSAIQGREAVFTVRTDQEAILLALYAENGARVHTWEAADCSGLDGSGRLWTVRYAVAGAGDRTLTFRASAGAYFGKGASLSLRVEVLRPGVLSVDSVQAEEVNVPVSFTVRTPAPAKTLALFNGDGRELKVWTAEESSVLEEGERVWTVRYIFTEQGSRTFTFRCAAEDGYDQGKEIHLTLTPPQPPVLSVQADPPEAKVQEEISFTAVTPVEAEYLALFAENGTKVKVWKQAENSQVQDDLRVWQVTYAVNKPGKRSLTFKASLGVLYGKGRQVAVTVK